MSDDIKWTVFLRARDKRWILSYVPKGGTWKKPKQITAPADITSERKARGWAEGELAKIRAGGGVHPERRRAGDESLFDLHPKLMAEREEHPDIEAATISNNWTHLRMVLGIPKTKSLIGKVVADKIAHMPMADVDVTEAAAFTKRQRAKHSPNHTRNIFSTMRSMWDVAEKLGKVKTSNPWKNALVIAELPAQKNLTGRDPIIVERVVAQALVNAPEDVVPLRRRARYAIAVCCGLDDGEIAGLFWGH